MWMVALLLLERGDALLDRGVGLAGSPVRVRVPPPRRAPCSPSPGSRQPALAALPAAGLRFPCMPPSRAVRRFVSCAPCGACPYMKKATRADGFDQLLVVGAAGLEPARAIRPPASETGASVYSATPRCDKIRIWTRTLVKNRGPRPFFLSSRLFRRHV